jgi:SAM-dependent methyltransferase
VSASGALLQPILSDPGRVRELAPGLHSVFDAAAAGAPYDRRAAAYDAIVGRSLYHRIFWGTSAGAFTRFARDARAAAEAGWFAEVGCGSLLFTRALYGAGPGPAILIDRSLGMLRRGMRRAAPLGPRVAFLQADAAALPIRSGVFGAILSLNLLHVPCDREGIIAEFARLLAPGGLLFLSCLVRSGRWSDSYLNALVRAGELGAPWTVESLRHAVAGEWATLERCEPEGNLCFLVARRRLSAA